MRVLAVDPAIRNTGYAVVEGDHQRATAMAWNVIRIPDAIPQSAALAAVLIAAADRALPVYEYAPRRVKQAVVGNGAADKQQVAFMVRALLGLAETPPHDAADALAIGIAHLQASDPLKAHLLQRRLV